MAGVDMERATSRQFGSALARGAATASAVYRAEQAPSYRGEAFDRSETALVVTMAEAALRFVESSREVADRRALSALAAVFAADCGFDGFHYAAACRARFVTGTTLSEPADLADNLPKAESLLALLASPRPRPARLTDGRAALVAPVHGPGGLKAMLLLASGAGITSVIERIRLGAASLQLAASQLYMTAEALRLAESLGQPADEALPALTRRERECMVWLARGKTAWEVSRILGITERTVTFHADNVKRKLGVSRRSQALALLMQNGELSL